MVSVVSSTEFFNCIIVEALKPRVVFILQRFRPNDKLMYSVLSLCAGPTHYWKTIYKNKNFLKKTIFSNYLLKNLYPLNRLYPKIN